MASADHPHEASNLIGFSRMLVRCRILSTADVDRTPLILICQLLGCYGSSTDILERLMKLFLKFGGLTTFVAHLLTSRTLGYSQKTLRPFSLFFSLFFSSFLTQRVYLMPPFFFEIRSRTPHLLISFKIVQNASLQYFYSMRG